MSKVIKKELLIPVKRAIGDFKMIEEGDNIAVGISGGKDSLSCLLALHNLLPILPVKYKLQAVIVDLGWPGQEADWSEIKTFCHELDIPLHIEKTQIAEIIFEHRQESNPCSLCSRMRNGALMDRAMQEGCNTVALGHHLDDAIETLLLNMFFAGKIDCFYPYTYLDRKGIKMIRPLVYIRESLTKRIAKYANLPVVSKKLCPADGLTKREYIKNLIITQEQHDQEIPVRLFSALKGLWEAK